MCGVAKHIERWIDFDRTLYAEGTFVEMTFAASPIRLAPANSVCTDIVPALFA